MFVRVEDHRGTVNFVNVDRIAYITADCRKVAFVSDLHADAKWWCPFGEEDKLIDTIDNWWKDSEGNIHNIDNAVRIEKDYESTCCIFYTDSNKYGNCRFEITMEEYCELTGEPNPNLQPEESNGAVRRLNIEQ